MCKDISTNKAGIAVNKPSMSHVVKTNLMLPPKKELLSLPAPIVQKSETEKKQIQLALPAAPVRKSLPAAPTRLALISKSNFREWPRPSRGEPGKYVYGGLTLWVREEQYNGECSKLVVSYRATPTKRSRLPYGKVLVEAKYALKREKTQTESREPALEVVEATLDYVLPRFFFPLLFKQFPQVKTAELTLKALGPFALHRLHQGTKSAVSTKKNQIRTLERMLAMWESRKIGELVPELCAPQLLAMDITPMKECIRLIRRLFEVELGSLVANPRIWHEYHMPARRKSYSPVRAAQRTTLNKPLSSEQVSAMVEMCEQNLRDPVNGAAYLCAMTMLIEGILVEECCALSAGAVVQLDGYEDFFGMHITKYVKTQGERAREDGHVRGQRHIIVDYDNDYEARWVGVSPRLATAWKMFRDSHPDVSDEDLLLFNPRNRDRVLAPEDYRQWLDDIFRSVFPRREINLAGRTILDNSRIADILQASAIEQLRDYGGYAAEELRYHLGQKPLEMDACHYAGFSAPTELTKMSLMQERAIRATKGCEKSGREKSKKRFFVPGIPCKSINAKISIRIPAGTEAKEIYIKMCAEMGLSAIIEVIPGGLQNA